MASLLTFGTTLAACFVHRYWILLLMRGLNGVALGTKVRNQVHKMDSTSCSINVGIGYPNICKRDIAVQDSRSHRCKLADHGCLGCNVRLYSRRCDSGGRA